MMLVDFIKKNKVGFISGGILGVLMPFIFFILWGLGLHKDTYSGFLDYSLLLGYIVSKKLIPGINMGLINVSVIVYTVSNFIYLSLIGAMIQNSIFLIKQKIRVEKGKIVTKKI